MDHRQLGSAVPGRGDEKDRSPQAPGSPGARSGLPSEESGLTDVRVQRGVPE